MNGWMYAPCRRRCMHKYWEILRHLFLFRVVQNIIKYSPNPFPFSSPSPFSMTRKQTQKKEENNVPFPQSAQCVAPLCKVVERSHQEIWKPCVLCRQVSNFLGNSNRKSLMNCEIKAAFVLVSQQQMSLAPPTLTCLLLGNKIVIVM